MSCGVASDMSESKANLPRLLLHCCCGPCATAVYERLSTDYEVLCYWYNPNIQPDEERHRRLEAMQKLARSWPPTGMELVVECGDEQAWAEAVAGLEQEPEGGRRCEICFAMRLRKAAQKAVELDCDYFASTLTVSPHKSAQIVNRCGKAIAAATGVYFLAEDFKRHAGFQRSVELARKYGLYRQDYCGCLFSRR
jgi:predicted adenine nucleotide alpha hydrolase (AANH) superfamily ATPase